MPLVDVVVIGGGPAGSTLAHTLTKGGASVVLLERATAPGRRAICGGVIPESLAQKIELTDECIHLIHTKQVHHFSEETFSIKLDSGGYVATTRPLFDSFLIQRAVNSGTYLVLGANVLNVDMTTGEVAYRQNDKIKQIKGSLVAYADGPTTLATKHGLGFDLLHQDSALCVMAEVECVHQLEKKMIYLYPTELQCGYIWIFPKSDHVNVGICDSKSNSSVALLRSVLKSYLQKIIPEIQQAVFRVGLFPRELAHKFALEREFVLGDAAGMVDPIGGGGIPYAIASSVLAGELILKQFTPAQYTECLRSTINYQIIKLLRKIMDYHTNTPHQYIDLFTAIRKWHLHIRSLSRTIDFQHLISFYSNWFHI